MDWKTQVAEHVYVTWVDGRKHWAAVELLEDSMPMEEDPDYQRWMSTIAEKCTSCPECWEVPCGACQAGGVCDSYCKCDECD